MLSVMGKMRGFYVTGATARHLQSCCNFRDSGRNGESNVAVHSPPRQPGWALDKSISNCLHLGPSTCGTQIGKDNQDNASGCGDYSIFILLLNL